MHKEIKVGEVSRRQNESVRPFVVSISKKLARDDPKQKKFDDFVLNMWACNRSTLDIVNFLQFKELIESCDSAINVKSRQAMTNKLEQEVTCKIIPELCKELNDVTSGTLSLDLWTSHRKDGILGVKFHFIDDNFEIQQRTVAIREVNEKHDAVILKKYVEKVIEDIGLSEKVSPV
ncbi:unnamed protein product [Allacma fusca]|uniref:Uncharacterized protein n=1 Tax=Allacma fusca TaxID=39272 RepID=A0A8J2NSZ0_9HEXA|nr:unnamed protein product [Allacma fusca]